MKIEVLKKLLSNNIEIFLYANNINISNFKHILIESRAFVFGEMLTLLYTEQTIPVTWEINDESIINNNTSMNILVNLENSLTIFHNLFNIGFTDYVETIYETPQIFFMLKNNIIGQINMYRNNGSEIILFIVENNKNLIDIIFSLNLSISMIWWDGSEDVNTYCYSDLVNKIVRLSDNYIYNYLDNNSLIIQEINKYRLKDFEISFELNKPLNFISNTKKPFDIIPDEVLVFSYLIDFVIKNINYQMDQILVSELQIFNLSYLIKKFNTTIYIIKELNTIRAANEIIDFYSMKSCIELMKNIYEPFIIMHNNNPANSDFKITFKTLLAIIITRELKICEDQDEIQIFSEILNINLLPTPEEIQNGSLPMCNGDYPPFLNSEPLFDLGLYDNFFIKVTKKTIMNMIKEQLENYSFFNINDYNLYINYLNNEENREKQENNSETLFDMIKKQNQANIQRLINLAREKGDLGEDEDENNEDFTIPVNLNGEYKTIGPRCFESTNATDINTKDWFEQGNFDVVYFLIKNDPDKQIYCSNLEQLEENLYNENKVVYQCKPSTYGYVINTEDGSQILLQDALRDNIRFDVSMRDINLIDAFVPVISTKYGEIYYISELQMKTLIDVVKSHNTYIFTLEFEDTINFTVTKRNTTLGTIGSDFVSTNHCQYGSSISYWTIVELNNDLEENYLESEQESDL